MVPENGYICGEIPSSLFTGIKSTHGFANMHDHVKRRLYPVSIDTRKNPTHASYCYDKLTNLSLNHEDTRTVLNIGLNIYAEGANVIGFICKNDSSLFE